VCSSDLVVLVVAGELDRGVVEAALPAWSGWTGAAAERPEPAAGRVGRFAGGVVWPTVPQAHPERPALDVVATLLGGSTRNGRSQGQIELPGEPGESLRRLRVDGPAQGELASAVDELQLGLEARADSLEGRAGLAAYCVWTWGEADCRGREAAAYAAVDVGAVRAAVARWLGEP
jgi:hypothetical protein